MTKGVKGFQKGHTVSLEIRNKISEALKRRVIRWLCFKHHREWHKVHENPELLEDIRDGES